MESIRLLMEELFDESLEDLFVALWLPLLRGVGRPVDGGMMLSSPETAMGSTGVRTPSITS
jgi:hypothetical protein